MFLQGSLANLNKTSLTINTIISTSIVSNVTKSVPNKSVNQDNNNLSNKYLFINYIYIIGQSNPKYFVSLTIIALSWLNIDLVVSNIRDSL